MCRHAAYVGPPLPLSRFLFDPGHSLVTQAYKPREMLTAELNADGFGIGWIGPDGRPGIYTNPMPIWSDINLAHLARVLSSPLWLGNVRSATLGFPVNQANTHPFAADGLMFSHNGFIRNFARTTRETLRHFIDAKVDAAINGNTDSEYLFAALRQVRRNSGNGDLVSAMRHLFDLLTDWLGMVPGLLNFLVADRDCVVASRHGLNHTSPSLYVGSDQALFPGGWVIASEPLSDAPGWQSVPEHHLVVIRHGDEPRILPL